MSRTARWSKPLEKILLFNSPYPCLSLRSFPWPVSLVLIVLSLGVHAPPTGWNPPPISNCEEISNCNNCSPSG